MGSPTKKLALFSITSLVLALGTACSDSSGSDSHDVTIAISVPVSGDVAPLAASMVKAAKLAVSQANERHDLPGKLTLDVEDDQEQPSVAASVARKLCGDDAVIGSISQFASSVTLASQPVYNRCGMVQIAPTASNDALTTTGYTNFFRVTARNVDTVVQSMVWVKKNWPEVKTVATIDTNDASTIDAASKFAEEAKGDGMTVLDPVHLSSGSGDFRGALTGMLQDKPDLIYLATFFNDGALVVKQARELGYQGRFIGVDANLSDDFISIAGTDAAEGVAVDTLGLDPTQNPAAGDFVTAYKAEYGEAPDSAAAQAYDAVNALIDAWDQVGKNDRKAIIEAVAKSDFDGVSGHISFDEHGDVRDPQVGMQVIKDGKFTYAGPANG